MNSEFDPDGEDVPSSFFYNDVYMWGRGSIGQLGTGHKKKRKKPTIAKELSRIGIVRVSCGGNHSAATTAGGSLYVWGSGESGCLGRGDVTTLAVPRKVLFNGGLKIATVSCGEHHTIMLTFDDEVYSVGSNVYGQLGHGHLNSCTVPKKIDFGDKKIRKIFCGRNQSACIDSSDILYTWGESRSGQLGHGFFFPQNTPKIVDALKDIPILEIDFGVSHAIALSKDGEVYLWGKTAYEIGSYTNPEKVDSLVGTRIVQVQSGAYHLVVLTSAGHVLAWGCGVHGQLGLEDKEDKRSPWLVKSLCDIRITRICCGEFHTMALSDEGRLFTWGDNQKFSCGHSSDRKDCPFPTEVILPPECSILRMFAGGLSCGVLVGLKEGISEANIGRLPRLANMDYAEEKSLRILIGSWNINAQSSLNLSAWFESEIQADIVVIGFQELIELTSHSVAQDEAKSKIAKTNLVRDHICKFWARSLENTLNCGSADYSLLKDIRLAGVYLAVFVKSYLRSRIFQVRADISKAGVLGKLGNKGGVAIRFSIFNSSNSLCFVNSHLAAGKAHVDKRNADYFNIISSLSFQLDKQKYSVLDHKKIFWLGDLNYRVDLERNDIVKKIEEQDWNGLLVHDQLTVERAQGRVFEGFDEIPIYFAPTYKYDPGTNNLDSSEKNRCPSWCDRILYRGENITPLLYRAHGDCLISDHKPVSAWFSIVVKETDITKRLLSMHSPSQDRSTELVPFNRDKIISPRVNTPNSPQVLSQNYRKRPSELADIPNVPIRTSPVIVRHTSPTWLKVSPGSAKNAIQKKLQNVSSAEQRKEYTSKLNDGINFIQKNTPKFKKNKP